MAATTPSPVTTYHSLVTTFTTFLTVAIHTILYERSLYPASTFISARAYNFPVRQSRHPKVCQWILCAVSALEPHLLAGNVERVVMAIFDEQSEVLERFVFDLNQWPRVDAAEVLTEFEEGISGVDIEEQLRATMGRLAGCGAKLGDLPKGCTYTLAFELRDGADPPIGVGYLVQVMSQY
jgi:mitotic spindle assembly checkpoint protein MAD2B